MTRTLLSLLVFTSVCMVARGQDPQELERLSSSELKRRLEGYKPDELTRALETIDAPTLREAVNLIDIPTMTHAFRTIDNATLRLAVGQMSMNWLRQLPPVDKLWHTKPRLLTVEAPSTLQLSVGVQRGITSGELRRLLVEGRSAIQDPKVLQV